MYKHFRKRHSQFHWNHFKRNVFLWVKGVFGTRFIVDWINRLTGKRIRFNVTQSRHSVGSQTCDDQHSRQDPLRVPLSWSSTCPHNSAGVKGQTFVMLWWPSDCLPLIMSLRQHTHTRKGTLGGDTCVFTLFFRVVCLNWSLGRDTLTSPQCHNNCYRRRSGGWATEASSWLDSLMMSSAIGSPSPRKAVRFQEKKQKLNVFSCSSSSDH